MNWKHKIVVAGVEEYNRAESDPNMTGAETVAAKATVRGVMVRADCYPEFCAALNGVASMERVYRRSDGSIISPYAPGGGPVGARK